MIKPVSPPYRWLLPPLFWLLLALACNAPMRGVPSPAPPPLPTLTPTEPVVAPEDTVEPAATIPILETAVIPQEPATSPTILPTFTPIVGPTLAATLPSTHTPTSPAQTATPQPTNTPASQGPLDFSYNISWRLRTDNPFMAVARVTIQATGGSGVYVYYHDDIRRSGATFEYNWAACQGNPGSLRVDSSDGQSVRKNYFENPPCPTPTPTPTS